MGLFRDNETNNLKETLHDLESQLVGGESVCYFTSVVEEQIQLVARVGLELGASDSQV